MTHETVGNPHVRVVEQTQSLLQQEGAPEDKAAVMVAESNIAVAFELRTIGLILVAFFDEQHTKRADSQTYKSFTENIARRLQ